MHAITDVDAWVHLCRYIFLVGMLMSQFTITGFDACAHMSEETVGADKSAPMAIVMAISVSAIAGFAYILAITFSIQVNTILTATTGSHTQNYPVLHIPALRADASFTHE